MITLFIALLGWQPLFVHTLGAIVAFRMAEPRLDDCGFADEGPGPIR